MKIVVCIRQGRNGEMSPFEASAYESALRIGGAEVILLSMGIPSTADYLKSLTRLGAKKAILLSDTRFAGADTLATAYALSLALKKLSPDYVFCGRQTMEGDTGQTGPMTSELLGYSLMTEVMAIKNITEESAQCMTRREGECTVKAPSLLTFERICDLRLPSLFSKMGEVEIWNAEDIGADTEKCGLRGSPTRVIQTFENQSGKRKCVFLDKDALYDTIERVLNTEVLATEKTETSDKKIDKVWIVGKKPIEFARSVSDDITVIDSADEEEIAQRITTEKPNAVLFATDAESKRLAGRVAARLRIGLCADCTSLETDGETLFMVRPALSGKVIAKIKSLTLPVMATVRTEEDTKERIVVSFGHGAVGCIDRVKAFAEKIGAGIGSSRKVVDGGLIGYDTQIGLTGKVIAPEIYIAIGISGAVQHLAGMQNSRTVIAINTDKKADIFEYADYGFVMSAEELEI
ncbi:MAG: FAD-binding protein [Clostridia bacterium]|nr:FAD-binding protein [Clostridia bacterium]